VSIVDGQRVRSASAGCSGRQIAATAAPCACGREAVVEKCGRTVCRLCADELHGREYPLRSGRQRCSFGSNLEKSQLDMMEFRGTPRYYGRYLG